MRVISDFHDYYDSTMGVGIDLELVYARKSGVFKIPHAGEGSWLSRINRQSIYDLMHEYEKTRTSSIVICPILIGFVGTIVPCLEFMIYDFDPLQNGFSKDPSASSCFYSKDEVLKELANLKLGTDEKKRHYYFRSNLDTKSIEWFFEIADWQSFSSLFREHSTPVFSLRPDRRNRELIGTSNPRLADFQFFKVVDPFTAFQDISMFLGGVLGVPEREVIEVSDATRAIKHGFDKMSFRKPPGTKKRRKDKP